MKHALLLMFTLCGTAVAVEPSQGYEFKLLATSKMSTMEKELNQLAEAGYSFRAVMGGETAFGGKEVVVVMGRSSTPAKRVYRLLAANRTSTLEREMQTAGEEGFEYKGQTVFESAFGGREVALIMERDTTVPARQIRYRLLATSKTSTMEKELAEVGRTGYDLLGMTVGKTSFGGSEVLCIVRQTAE